MIKNSIQLVRINKVAPWKYTIKICGLKNNAKRFWKVKVGNQNETVIVHQKKMDKRKKKRAMIEMNLKITVVITYSLMYCVKISTLDIQNKTRMAIL